MKSKTKVTSAKVAHIKQAPIKDEEMYCYALNARAEEDFDRFLAEVSVMKNYSTLVSWVTKLRLARYYQILLSHHYL